MTMTLRQLLDEADAAQSAGTRTPQQEQLQAAYWAGIEIGRGELAREVDHPRYGMRML
jgi:hypothetical protein